MAARFWVGGTGNWSDTAHWAATTGGAGGQSVPTSADDVTLNAASGAGTLTVDVSASAKTFTSSAYTGAITLNAGLSVFGNAVLPNAAITIAGSFGLTMAPAVSTTATVQSNGSRFNGGAAISGAGTMSLLDNFVCGGTFTHSSGTLLTNNHAISCAGLNTNNATARTLTLGSSTITITGSGTTTVDVRDGTSLTVTANTATLSFTGGGGINVPGGFDFAGLSLAYSGSGGTFGSAGAIFRNLTVTGTAQTNVFTFTSACTFTGVVTFAGSAANARMLVRTNSNVGSGGNQSAITVTVSGSHGAHTNADFQDVSFAGSAGNLSGTLIGDAGGNSGITFTGSQTQQWQGTSGGNWSSAAKWTSRVPLPQDDVLIQSAFSAAQTITLDQPRLGRSVDFSGTTGAPAVASSNSGGSAIYGSLTLAAGVTVSIGQTVTLAGRGSFTLNLANVSFGPVLQLLAPGGAYTLLKSTAAHTGALQITSGSFDCNGNGMTWSGALTLAGVTVALPASFLGGIANHSFGSVSVSAFSQLLGSGTWSLTGSGTVWTASGTGAFFSLDLATLVVADTSSSTKTFAGGGFNYGSLQHVAAGTGGLTITGNNSFRNLDVESSANRTLTLPGGAITAVSGTLTLNSTTQLAVVSSTSGQQTTIELLPGATQTQLNAALSSDVAITSGQNAAACQVISDAARTAALSWGTGQQGGQTDGIAVGAGFGVYHRRTNLFRHGQCGEVGTGTNDRWNSRGSGTTTVATDATVPARFSPQSIRVTTDGTFASQGAQAASPAALGAAPGVAGAGSIYFKGVQGASYVANVEWVNLDTSTTAGTNLTVVATGQWQELLPASVAVASGTGDWLRINVLVNGTRAETFWLAHAELETGIQVPGAYVATSAGASATSFGGGVQVPASYLDANAGFWVALLWTPSWPATARTDNLLGFEWRTNANNKVEITYAGIVARWNAASRTNGVLSTALLGTNQTFTSGQPVFVVGKFSPALVGVSAGGGAFATTANAHFVAPALPFFTLGGALGPASELDASLVWAACGYGYMPTDADAATLQAAALAGQTDPAQIQMCCSAIFPFATAGSAYVTPGFGRWNSPTRLRVNAGNGTDGRVVDATLPYLAKTAAEQYALSIVQNNFPDLTQI